MGVQGALAGRQTRRPTGHERIQAGACVTYGPGDDLDGDGCESAEDSDNDGDKVADAADNCPLDANPAQADLDADGIGDACDPTDDRPGTVPAPNAVAPETTFGHFPKNPKRDHTHFRFRSSIAGSTFTCKLDKQDPESCKSPQDYRTLEPGRHVFRVFATSPQGVSDATPAKARFRISADAGL